MSEHPKIDDEWRDTEGWKQSPAFQVRPGELLTVKHVGPICTLRTVYGVEVFYALSAFNKMELVSRDHRR